MAVTTLLIDIDETILDFEKEERTALCGVLEKINVTASDELIQCYRTINQKYWRFLEIGKMTRQEVLVGRFAEFFEVSGIDYSPEQANLMYKRNLGLNPCFLDFADRTLEELVTKYRIFGITNGTESIQKSRLHILNAERFFEDIFISEAIGADKPSKEYFSYVYAHIPNFEKEKTIVVGDSITSDIRGGVENGLRTIWLNSRKEKNTTNIIPDYEIARLSELPTLLEKL